MELSKLMLITFMVENSIYFNVEDSEIKQFSDWIKGLIYAMI